jgi:hypothetical protein
MSNNINKKQMDSIFESPFIQALKTAVRKTEVPLPIAKLTANVIPLSVGDDAKLRTAVMSPANYDRELLQLLYLKTEFINPSNPSEPFELSYDQFCSILTNHDKLMLLWAIYKCTYETFGTKLVTCPNENCGTKFEVNVTLDSLIQEDSITPWDKESPVSEYVYPVTIEDKQSNLVYIFDSHLPNLYRTNSILSRLSTTEIQHNLETQGSIYTLKDIVVSITKKITIHQVGNTENVVETIDLADIDLAFSRYIKKTIWDQYKKKYDEHFGKYDIKFYTKLTCPKCQKQFNYDVDLELEFFRRSLLE